MIRTEGLTRRYGETLAVDSVSFEIDRAEIVGLLGHNGAGKSTIMKMLTGFLEPSDGTVTIDGLDVAVEPKRVQANLGYLPETLPLYPEMTVVDYLDYVTTLRNVTDRPAAIRRALAATDLIGRATDVIGTLSRGFRQRVGVAQAIVHEPGILILDEPTNGLDPSQTQQMRHLIQSLAENATVILSTHIMQEVNAICDRVMILSNGRLAVDERLDALQESGRLRLETDAEAGLVARALDGIAEVTVDDDALLLHLATGGADERAEVAKRLVAGNVAVHALHPAVRDLEAIFREASEEVPHAA